MVQPYLIIKERISQWSDDILYSQRYISIWLPLPNSPQHFINSPAILYCHFVELWLLDCPLAEANQLAPAWGNECSKDDLSVNSILWEK